MCIQLEWFDKSSVIIIYNHTPGFIRVVFIEIFSKNSFRSLCFYRIYFSYRKIFYNKTTLDEKSMNEMKEK